MRFYCDNITEGQLELSGDEGRHLSLVLRAAVGDQIELFDGKGVLAGAQIVQVKKEKVLLAIKTLQHIPPRKTKVMIASSIAKGERFDWLIEKCVELGVDHIWPVLFERTVKQGKENAGQRYHKLAISAAKQSQNVFIPDIASPAKLPDVISYIKEQYPSAQIVFGSLSPHSRTIAQITQPVRDIVAMIGPEGGMSDAEEQLLQNSGAIPVKLTSTILRIETAAVTFAAALCLARDSHS